MPEPLQAFRVETRAEMRGPSRP